MKAYGHLAHKLAKQTKKHKGEEIVVDSCCWLSAILYFSVVMSTQNGMTVCYPNNVLQQRAI